MCSEKERSINTKLPNATEIRFLLPRNKADIQCSRRNQIYLHRLVSQKEHSFMNTLYHPVNIDTARPIEQGATTKLFAWLTAVSEQEMLAESSDGYNKVA